MRKVLLLVIIGATFILPATKAAFAAAGNLNFCDALAQRQSTSTRSPVFTVRPLVENDSKAADTPVLVYPVALAYDAKGDLYILDRDANRVLRLDEKSKKLEVVAGPSSLAGSTYPSGLRDGFGSSARFSRPSGITVAENGNIYVADSGNGAIRVMSPSGNVKTLRAVKSHDNSIRLATPVAVAVDTANNVFVADSTSGILKIDPLGVLTKLPVPTLGPMHLAVTGRSPFSTLMISDATGLWLFRSPAKARHFPIAFSKNAADESLEGRRSIGVPGAVSPLRDKAIFYSDQKDHTVRFIDFDAHIGRVVAKLSDAPIGIAAKDSSAVATIAGHRILLVSQLDLRMPLVPSSGSRSALDFTFGPRDKVIFFVGTSFIWWNTDWPNSIEGRLESSLRQSRESGERVHVVPVQMPGSDIPSAGSYIDEVADLAFTRIAILDVHATFLATTFSISPKEIAGKSALWKNPFTRSIAKLKQSMDSRGKKLLIVLHPEEFELLRPGRAPLEILLTSQLRALGVNVLDLYPIFHQALREHRQLYGLCDKHLEAYGRALTAEQVAKYIETVFWSRRGR